MCVCVCECVLVASVAVHAPLGAAPSCARVAKARPHVLCSAGRSLGGAVAIWLARRNPVRAFERALAGPPPPAFSLSLSLSLSLSRAR
eukprot:COSAG01_NODE_14645_length_1427_cov_1.185994_1_plen_87_part_10